MIHKIDGDLKKKRIQITQRTGKFLNMAVELCFSDKASNLQHREKTSNCYKDILRK